MNNGTEIDSLLVVSSLGQHFTSFQGEVFDAPRPKSDDSNCSFCHRDTIAVEGKCVKFENEGMLIVECPLTCYAIFNKKTAKVAHEKVSNIRRFVLNGIR